MAIHQIKKRGKAMKWLKSIKLCRKRINFRFNCVANVPPLKTKKENKMNRREVIEKAKNEMNNQLFYSAAKRLLEYLEETETTKSGRNDLLVRQLLALINFLVGYHNEASQARYMIGLETDLERAKHIAIFEYPVIQGLMFNLTLKQMSDWGLPSDNDLIDKAVEYIEKNYKPSKQSA